MVTVIAVGKQIEIDPGKLRINEDIVEICEKDINNLTFGTSYAEFISRITGDMLIRQIIVLLRRIKHDRSRKIAHSY